MIGFDVGSRTAKLVIMGNGDDDNDNDDVISDYKIINSRHWKELLDTVMTKNRTSCDDSVCTTGYFRKKIPNDCNITEITAAVSGVHYYYPDADVVVDIGGQDTKIIDMRDNSFQLNDKCSAGTGAFLEFIAKYFDMDVKQLGTLHAQAKNPATLNQTCGIFALSEMISCMVNEDDMADVVAGMHNSFARRISHMIPECGSVVLIGGVVKNSGIVSALSEMLDCEILLPPEPQIVNALGAALYGKEMLSAKDSD